MISMAGARGTNMEKPPRRPIPNRASGTSSGGLRYAMGTGTIDFSRARPEENRFTRVVLAEKLDEPVELAVLPGERVLFVERHGYVNLYSPATRRVKRIATIPVSTKYADSSQAEDGLLGLAADPNFATNGWIYMYYSPAGPESKNVLARFQMKGDSLDLGSKKILLEIPTQRLKCCHTGGSIAFDTKGNLYMSTGDNSNPFASGYAPVDERPGRMPWDAQKSSANTNDLRGKIIRIHPQPDGTYTIPEGNLFPPGTAQTRPEIYTMGHRNPYRLSVDSHTGFLYWGDVGPDANVDSAGRGPRGYDEINQARSAGNYGWPYFVGNNQAYYRTTFSDSVTVVPGEQFDPAHPINRSPNNTGLTELPPRAALTSGIRTRRHRSSRSSAAADEPRQRVRSSTATTSAARPDHSRSTTTASFSSTNSCATGSWQSPWIRRAISCP